MKLVLGIAIAAIIIALAIGGVGIYITIRTLKYLIWEMWR